MAAALAQATGRAVEPSAAATAVSDGIVVLDRAAPLGRGIASLAGAIGAGDADGAVEVLGSEPDGVRWIPVDAADPDMAAHVTPVRDAAVEAARTVIGAASAGDADAAMTALGGFRLLCAHRRGDYGVASGRRASRAGSGRRSPASARPAGTPGRPLLVTENDYGLRLYNGDTGVVVASARATCAAFERRGEVVDAAPERGSGRSTPSTR